MDWSKLRTIEAERLADERAAAQRVLAETDWFITRAADPSDQRQVPADVLARRQAARAVLRGDEGDG